MIVTAYSFFSKRRNNAIATVLLTALIFSIFSIVQSFIQYESASAIEKAALELESVKRHTEGKTIRKVIIIKNRIVNIVVA